MSQIYDLIPRLISHQESQLAYYERQLEAVKKELARLALIDSGQLMLWDEPLYAKGTVEGHFLQRANYGYIEGNESQDRQGGQVVQSLGEES